MEFLNGTLASMIMPLILCLTCFVMAAGKGRINEAFVSGAREGLRTCVNLVPTLVLLVSAVGMFNASGAASAFAELIEPVMTFLGVPPETVTLLIVRPVSGGASTSLLNSLFGEVGADSFAGLCGSVIAGSSDTVFYITALYFSSVGVTKTGHALPVALAVMVFCIFFGCFICRLFF